MKNDRPPQTNNPLHGISLEVIITDLVAVLGWAKMGEKIPINCFLKDPSIKSSLAFLRKTPWARAKVETMYTFNLKKIAAHKAKSASPESILHQAIPTKSK